VQVDPGFSQLTLHVLLTLETENDKLLSKFAFNCNLRHYSEYETKLARAERFILVGRCRLTLGFRS